MPSACIMRCSAAVHELTATQSSAPCMVANASSKDRTRSPIVSQPLSMMVDKANLSGSPTMAELTKSMVDFMCDELSGRRPQCRDHFMPPRRLLLSRTAHPRRSPERAGNRPPDRYQAKGRDVCTHALQCHCPASDA